MERVHFHRKPTGLVIVRVNHKAFKGGRFCWSTSQSVTPENWTNGMIKRDKPTSGITTYPTIRKYFEAIRTVCTSHLAGQVKADKLKNQLMMLTKRVIHQSDEFFDVYENIINTTKVKGKPITEGTKRSKRQSMNKLMEFNPDLTFQDVTIDFYYEYSEWLENNTPRTVGKHIKELKAIMAQAHDRGINICMDYTKSSFAVPRLEKDSTFLTMEEIEKVYKAEVEQPHLKKIRDVFVVACLTGQRIGDWHQLSPDNLDGDLLKVVQQKGGNTVYVPVHHIVRMVWDKYNGLPELPSEQKINKHLKEVCAKAKLGKIMIDGKLEEKTPAHFKPFRPPLFCKQRLFRRNGHTVNPKIYRASV